MYAVFKRELFSLLNSMMAYITIGVFLLVSGLLLWVFPDTSILDYGYAELNGFFKLAPLLLLFFIPAFTMRSFAEERREGTYVLLASKPVTEQQIILAKYFAVLSMIAGALLPTGLYYYSISELGLPKGNIDGAAVAGSFTGLFLLGSSLAAIGLLASAMARNQVVAFTIAVFFSFIAYMGFDALAKLAVFGYPETIFSWLSMNTHFESMSRGVLDTRDIIYFISFIFLFLGLTRMVIGGRKW